MVARSLESEPRFDSLASKNGRNGSIDPDELTIPMESEEELPHDLVRMYLRDIGRTPLLTEEAEQALGVKLWRG